MIALTALTVLALQAAAPAPTCEVTDNACKARQFIDKARTAPPGARALYLYTAHRSYLALFAQTGKVQDLCAARASFDRSVGVQGQSEGQRASFEASRAELLALEKQYGARCGAATKRRRRVEATPVVAPPRDTNEAAVAAPVSAEPAGPTGPAMVAEPGVVAEPVSALAPAPGSLRPPIRDEWPAPATPLRTRPRGRPLVIAGGVTLGVSFALACVAGYGASQLSVVARASRDLYETVHGQGDANIKMIEARLRAEYRSWLPMTVSTTIAASSALVVGAVLVSLGVRKLRESPSRTALVPFPGGLAIHARF